MLDLMLCCCHLEILNNAGTSNLAFSLCTAAAAKSFHSCPTLCNPIDGSPPGSAVPGILQARTLEWVAISFSRRSSNPGIELASLAFPALQANSLPLSHLGSPEEVLEGLWGANTPSAWLPLQLPLQCNSCVRSSLSLLTFSPTRLFAVGLITPLTHQETLSKYFRILQTLHICDFTSPILLCCRSTVAGIIRPFDKEINSQKDSDLCITKHMKLVGRAEIRSWVFHLRQVLPLLKQKKMKRQNKQQTQ